MGSEETMKSLLVIRASGAIEFQNHKNYIHREGWKPARILPDGVLEYWIDNDCYYIDRKDRYLCHISYIKPKGSTYIAFDKQTNKRIGEWL